MPSQVPTGKGLSTLSADLTFEGNVSGAGDLQVDGTVKGDLRVGRLIVGETGAVEGNVSADYVEVRGRIVGGVNGKQIKLLGTAYVDGDITHEQLSIDVGAYFQGRCIQGRRDAAPTPAASSAASTAPAATPATSSAAPASTPGSTPASTPASSGDDTIQPFQAKTPA
ncbi:polymer-forming cytoskeletal protein [Brevundimonas sp.]|uniref:bactofilin family protein n=1 Tax=Brevundimonas sp. TaxID=1871086 RepID=UPI001D2BB860|nr:polymer-forming cytoskeletal protein [Brevundimonas sp.]MBA4001146.1 cell shape determination protein CcmA [Brevundimonas sp.]